MDDLFEIGLGDGDIRDRVAARQCSDKPGDGAWLAVDAQPELGAFAPDELGAACLDRSSGPVRELGDDDAIGCVALDQGVDGTVVQDLAVID
jgi:hypothetical protein